MPTKTAPRTFTRKIVDLDTLTRHREMAHRSGKTIVHCHGCFDIVHPGHIRYFQFAKQQGDLLVVSLTGDPHVGKGEGRPYVPQELRAENLAALEFIDYVYINPTATAVDLLSTFRPDIYIKGREYEHNQHPGFLKEKSTVESYGGRVIFSSGDVVYSSSHIIDNYAQSIDLEQEKLALFCQRYRINRTTLTAALDRVLDRPYVVVGDMLLDRYQYCDASDLAPDAPMMSLVPLEHRDYLGGAAILAQHLMALGAKVTLISSFGQDDASDGAIDSLDTAGIHVLPIRNRKKIAAKTRFLVDQQKLFLVDEAPAVPTDSANAKYLLDQIAEHASADASLLLYDAGLGLFTDPLATEVVARRSGYHKLIAGTAGSRGRLMRLREADLIVASERALRSAERDYEQGVSSLAYRFLHDSGGKSILLPSGKKGLLAFDAREDSAPADSWEGKLRSEYIASPTNGTIDRLGFDESLLAVSAALLGAGANLHQSAYVALATAIMESRHIGQSPLDADAIRSSLQVRPELS